MIVTLTRPENAKSAIKLGYPVFSSAYHIPNASKVIRWGNGMDSDKPGWALVLNKSATLQLSIDKLAALQALSRTVKTPDLKTEGTRTTSGSWVVRPHNHAEGSDFEVRDGAFTVPSGYHATRFIPYTREYRVWFIRDKYLVAKRVPRTSEGQSSDDQCRSKWGYSFCDVVFSKLKEEMGKARLAIPLDFGAADVLWTDDWNGSGSGAYAFLEINSAPSLDHDRVLEHFQTHLASILGPQTAQVVPEVVPTRENAANRSLECRSNTPVATVDWKARYKAKLAVQVAAEKAAIEKEFYDSL